MARRPTDARRVSDDVAGGSGFGDCEMTTEPRLLSEAEAKGAWMATFSLHAKSFAEYLDELRERGLIAPEPVDPLLVEARKQADKWWPDEGALIGSMDGSMWMERILAVLRRGMELGRAERLTRKQVRDAIYNGAPGGFFSSAEAFIDRVYASLTGGDA